MKNEPLKHPDCRDCRLIMSYEQLEDSLRDMNELLKEKIARLEREIRGLEESKDLPYTLISREIVENRAFDPKVSGRIAKRYLKALQKADKLLSEEVTQVSFLEYPTGKIVVREY